MDITGGGFRDAKLNMDIPVWLVLLCLCGICRANEVLKANNCAVPEECEDHYWSARKW